MIDITILMGNGKVAIGSGSITFVGEDIKIPKLVFSEIISDKFNVGDEIEKEIPTKNTINILIPNIKTLEQIEEKLNIIRNKLSAR